MSGFLIFVSFIHLLPLSSIGEKRPMPKKQQEKKPLPMLRLLKKKPLQKSKICLILLPTHQPL